MARQTAPSPHGCSTPLRANLPSFPRDTPRLTDSAMKTGEIFGTQGEEVGRIVRTRTPKMADGKNRDPPPKIGIGVGSRNAALQSERRTQLRVTLVGYF